MTRRSNYTLTGGRKRTAAEKARQRAKECAMKRHYLTWDEAEAAGLRVYFESPKPFEANPPGAYVCPLPGPKHYHVGHLHMGPRQAVA